MDKKVLRRYAESATFQTDGISAETISVDGEETLAVTISTKGFNGVVFLQKHDDLTAEITADGLKWRTGSLENIDYRHYYELFPRHMECDTRESFLKIVDFTGLEASAYNAINAHQRKIREEKAEVRKNIRLEKTKVEMTGLSEFLPDGVMDLAREKLPAHILYDGRAKKAKKALCTKCQSQIDLIGKIKIGMEYTCPKCNTTAKLSTYKSLTTSGFYNIGNSSGKEDARTTLVVLDKNSSGKLVVRVVKAYFALDTEGHLGIFLDENQRFILDGAKAPESYYRRWDNTWVHGKKPGGGFTMYWYDYFKDTEGILYGGNLTEALKDTPYQYSGIDRMANLSFEAEKYLYAYQMFPGLEFIAKVGLTTLASQLGDPERLKIAMKDQYLDFDAKKPYEFLRLSKDMFKYAVKENMSYSDIVYAQVLYQADGYINPIAFRILKEANMGILYLEDLRFVLSKMSGAKFARYFKGQMESSNRRLSSVINDYKDYLKMREQLTGEIKSSFMLFPANLKQAHDTVMRLSRGGNLEQFNAAIQKKAEELKEVYGFEDDDYCIVIPKNVSSICLEAVENRNCVDKYIEAMAGGQTTILFLRHKDRPEKSLVTIEVIDGVIKQARTFDNGDPDEELSKIISLFAKKKNLSMEGMNYQDPRRQRQMA